jgi:hypothetical protein
VKAGFGLSELERALARDDVEELRKVAQAYHDWSERETNKDENWPDELDVWFGHDNGDDTDLALIMIATYSYDSTRFLSVVAAGKLEDLLSHNPATRGYPLSEQLLGRVLDECRRTPRFRWLLSGMWTSSDMNPSHVAAIREAVGSVSMDNDPLPPRPWA